MTADTTDSGNSVVSAFEKDMPMIQAALQPTQQPGPSESLRDPNIPKADMRPKVAAVAGAQPPLDANKLAAESALPPVINSIPAPAPSNAPTEPPQQPSRQQKLAAACQQAFLRIQELQGANYTHRGYCADCGWQTFQHSKDEAYAITSLHVMSHWRKVALQV